MVALMQVAKLKHIVGTYAHSTFNYTILLWQVMDGEFMFSSYVLVLCEFVREEFSPSIRV